MAHSAAALDRAETQRVTVLPSTAFARRWARGRRAAALLTLAVVAGFAMRWATARVDTLVASDSCQYLLLARGVAEGRGFSSGGSEHPDAARLPLFPLLVAAVGAPSGDFEFAARLVVSLAGALAAVPLWFLGRRVFGPDAALAGAFLGAFSCLAGNTGILMPDPLALTGILAGCASVASAVRRPAAWRFARTGALLGVAALCRAESVVAVPLFVAAAVVGRGDRRRPGTGLLRAVLVLVAACAVYAPYVAWASMKLGRVSAAPGIEYLLDMRDLSDRLGLRGIGPAEILWGDKARYMLDREGRRPLLETYFLEDRLPEIAESGAAGGAAGSNAPRGPGWRRRYHDLLRRKSILMENLARVPRSLNTEHLAPAGPWLLALAGAGILAARPSARRSTAVLLAAGATSLIPYYSHVEGRFGYAIFAGVLVFAAGSWGAVAAALRSRTPVVRTAVHLLLAAVVVVPALAHDPRAGTQTERRRAQRNFAASASRALPDGPVLAIRPHIPYFMGRAYRPLPIASPETVVRFAREAGAVGIVLEGAMDRRERPDLSAWHEGRPSPGLRLAAELPDSAGGSFRVYALGPVAP